MWGFGDTRPLSPGLDHRYMCPDDNEGHMENAATGSIDRNCSGKPGRSDQWATRTSKSGWNPGKITKPEFMLFYFSNLY